MTPRVVSSPPIQRTEPRSFVVQGQGAARLGGGGRSSTGGGAFAEEADGGRANLLARAIGYSLHAGQVVPAGHRERLEQLCRYVLRPPVVAERLDVTEAGQVRLTFKQPWRDGTRAMLFDPVVFLERLAVLVPRPRSAVFATAAGHR